MLSLDDLRQDPAFVFGMHASTQHYFDDPQQISFYIPACDSVLKLNPESILDVGCFTGYAARYFRFQNYSGKYTGIDINKTAIRYARERLPKEHFRVQSFFDADIPKTDVVFASRVIIHLDDPESAINRLLAIANRAVVLTAKIVNEAHVTIHDSDYGKYQVRYFQVDYFDQFGAQRRIEKQGKYHTITLWNKPCR